MVQGLGKRKGVPRVLEGSHEYPEGHIKTERPLPVCSPGGKFFIVIPTFCPALGIRCTFGLVKELEIKNGHQFRGERPFL